MSPARAAFGGRTAAAAQLQRASARARPRRGGRAAAAAPRVRAGAVDAAAATAITQQAIAYVVAVGGEAAYTGLRPDMKGAPGAPAVVPTLAGIAGTLVGVALLQSEGTRAAGAVVGLAAGGAMLAVYAARAAATRYDPATWPGDKAWPAAMALVSFFSAAAFAQGLAEALR